MARIQCITYTIIIIIITDSIIYMLQERAAKKEAEMAAALAEMEKRREGESRRPKDWLATVRCW